MRKGIRSPHLWLSGPDPIDNDLYNQCLKRRAQARFRGEDWLITPHEYIRLWREDDRYQRQGRHSSDLCMARIDHEKSWTLDNVHFITRYEHAQNCQRIQVLMRQGGRL
jgi:hypothetical protein